MSVIIRPLTASDQKEWAQLWRGYLDFYGTQLEDTVYDVTFARNIDPTHRAQSCLVAEKDGVLVGLVHYIFHAHNWRVEDVIYLQDLYADPSVRGLGVGRQLIQGVYDAADAAGTPVVHWMTQENNYTGRQLYDRIGTKTPFVQYKR